MQPVGGPSAFGPALFLFETAAEVSLAREALQPAKAANAKTR